MTGPRCAWCHKRHGKGVECPVRNRESSADARADDLARREAYAWVAELIRKEMRAGSPGMPQGGRVQVECRRIEDAMRAAAKP